MRPRLSNPDLPKYVQLRHGAYYFVRDGKWKLLARELETALKAYHRHAETPANGIPEPIAAVPGVIPAGIFSLNGNYYQVVRGIWKRLGPSISDIGNIAQTQAALPLDRKILLAHTFKVVDHARQNAKGRGGLAFELMHVDVLKMLTEAGWRCSVTGTPFTLEVVRGKRPYAPSIDRIDNKKGYIPGNCRVVCVATNYAMNVWGEGVLHRLLGSLNAKNQGISKLLQTVRQKH